MNKIINTKNILLVVFILVFSVFMGCQDNSTVNPIGNSAENLSVSGVTSLETETDNAVLVINEVKIMVREIELETEGEDGEDFEVELGPMVYVLNMDPTRVQMLTAKDIDFRTFDKIKFKIHRLNPEEPTIDPEFVDNQGRYSVIIKGTYDGMPFLYKSQISAVQKLYMPIPLTLTSDRSQNITLRVAPYMWFTKNGMTLNPLIPEDSKEIDKNIKNNLKGEIKAFRDNDHDGDPD